MRVKDVKGIDPKIADDLEKLLRRSERIAQNVQRIAAGKKITRRRGQALQREIFGKIQNIVAQITATHCFEATPKSTYQPHQLTDGRVVMRCGHSPFHTMRPG
ncbi:hypothetical protein [Hyphomonas beringensis]|uniref:hypothetical protein n=1 Tax=Hyphomonas beringensis TaxID=1280946 RepID=UPI000A6F3474|nr:hypothetical protein [Hyphomonas beringensis]